MTDNERKDTALEVGAVGAIAFLCGIFLIGVALGGWLGAGIVLTLFGAVFVVVSFKAQA